MRPIDAERFCPRGDLDRCWGNEAPEARRATSSAEQTNKLALLSEATARRIAHFVRSERSDAIKIASL